MSLPSCRETAVRNAAAALTVLLLAATARAEEKPIQIALFDPVQIFDRSMSIKGGRLNVLYGFNADVRGLDIGLANRTSGSVKGFQWGVFGLVEADFEGWQYNFISITEGFLQGLQTGAVTSNKSVKGVQIAFINVSKDVEGLQLGLLNITHDLHGLQIGLLNVAQGKDKLPVLPIVNWNF
ncbi:MAG: LA_2272 family surface repeat-containing protein [bacterium]